MPAEDCSVLPAVVGSALQGGLNFVTPCVALRTICVPIGKRVLQGTEVRPLHCCGLSICRVPPHKGERGIQRIDKPMLNQSLAR